MAVIANQNKDDDSTTPDSGITSSDSSGSGPSASTPQSGTSSAAPQAGGTTSAGGSNKASGQGNSGNNSATTSGNFTNIQNYLNANKGYNADQGGLAGQTYNKLNTQAQGINNQVNQNQQTFNDQSQAGRNQYDSSLVNGALADPTAAANNAGTLNQFQNQLSGTYAGPNALSNQGQLQNQTQNFQNLSGLANNENGRYALLSQLYGNGNYNQGQQSLDNMLIQSNPGQLKTLQSASQLGNQAANNLSNATNQASQQAQQFGQEAANTNKQTLGAYNNSVNDFTGGLNNNLSTTQGNYQSDLDSANKQLGSNNVSDNLLNQLGLTAGTNTYNLNLSDYLNKTAPTLDLNNVATQGNVNTSNALEKLGGSSDLKNLNLTPTAAPSEYNFDTAGYQNALTNAQGAYKAGFYNPTQVGGAAGNNYSLSDLQGLAQGVANGMYGGDLNALRSSTNAGTATKQAQQYLAQIDAYNKSQGLQNILQGYSATATPQTAGTLTS